MSFFETGFAGLFLISFLSATILPIASEGVLLALLLAGYDPWISLVVASIGNILGGCFNYWLGRLGNIRWLTKLGFREEKINGFQLTIEKHGFWLAALSWVPIIGDPLLVALGFFKSHWWRIFFIMSFTKIIRYFVLSLPWIV